MYRKRICIDCSNEVEYDFMQEYILIAQVPLDIKYINFINLFDTNIINIECQICHQNEHNSIENIRIGIETKYVLLEISSAANQNLNIKSFNSDFVEIPGIIGASFTVKPAICYYSINGNNYGKNGHYAIWFRSICKTGWMRISDDHAKFYPNLIKDLKDVKLLMLEKN